MMKDIKKNELNDMEMNKVAGGSELPLYQTTKELMEMYKEQNIGQKQDEAVFEAVDTAWEVIKYALEKNFLK